MTKPRRSCTPDSLEQIGRWNEGNPPKVGSYLIANDYGVRDILFWTGDVWVGNGKPGNAVVVAWMHLPPVPSWGKQSTQV